jgi:hypothetical protein
MELYMVAAEAAVLAFLLGIELPMVKNQMVSGNFIMLQAVAAADEVAQILLQVVRVALPVVILVRIQLVMPATLEQRLALALVAAANDMLAKAAVPVVLEVISVRPVAQVNQTQVVMEQIYMEDRRKLAVLLVLLCLETVILLGLIRVQDMAQFLKWRKNEY